MRTENKDAVYYNQAAKTKLCPTCNRNKIYSNHLSVYNTKNAAGIQVCTECKIDEIYRSMGVEG